MRINLRKIKSMKRYLVHCRRFSIVLLRFDSLFAPPISQNYRFTARVEKVGLGSPSFVTFSDQYWRIAARREP